MNSKELLSNGPYASQIIIWLLGTEFIISLTFQCERYFTFCLSRKILTLKTADAIHVTKNILYEKVGEIQDLKAIV